MRTEWKCLWWEAVCECTAAYRGPFSRLADNPGYSWPKGFCNFSVWIGVSPVTGTPVVSSTVIILVYHFFIASNHIAHNLKILFVYFFFFWAMYSWPLASSCEWTILSNPCLSNQDNFTVCSYSGQLENRFGWLNISFRTTRDGTGLGISHQVRKVSLLSTKCQSIGSCFCHQILMK